MLNDSCMNVFAGGALRKMRATVESASISSIHENFESFLINVEGGGNKREIGPDSYVI